MGEIIMEYLAPNYLSEPVINVLKVRPNYHRSYNRFIMDRLLDDGYEI